MPFLVPEDLVESVNVRLEAQLPHRTTVLIAKDADRAKLWYAPVAAEPAGSGARVWYQRVDSGEKEYADQRTLCVGVIGDGAWHPVPLDPAPPAWGGVNNVCLRRSPFKPTWGGFNVFQVLRGRAGEGYHLLYWDQPDEKGKAGGMLAHSADGLRWEKSAGTVFTEYNDAFSLASDREGYLVYQTCLEDWPDKPYPDNLDKKRRVQSIRRSKDLRAWTAQEVFLRPDALDPPETEFYLMKTFQLDGVTFGLLMKYLADPARPKKHSGIMPCELIVARDATQWERPFRKTDLGFWSYADPVRINGELTFVFGKDGGMSAAAYLPDRLVAAVARGEVGGFVTRPFPYSRTLVLDADAAKGWIEAELLTASGEAVNGVRPVRIEGKEGTGLPLEFAAVPATLQQCRLRFKMKDARLFAAGSNQMNFPVANRAQPAEPDGRVACLPAARRVTRYRSVCLGVAWLLAAAGAAAGADAALPQGDARAALQSPYFPDRLHEFIWRNWNVVAPGKMAQVLGTTERKVAAMAESMGLPPSAGGSPEMLQRGYATIIRRNWHLLPYDQLLQLLDWTPERLSFTLREEDFLWVKLGRLKPRCEPLRYREPDPAARLEATRIRRVVRADFGAAVRRPGVPRFDFVRELSRPLPMGDGPAGSGPGEDPQQRLVYSYVAVYGDPLLNPKLNPYPDGLLQRLAAVGVNGVWLQAVLRDLAPGGSTFPEFGKGHEARLANLRALVQRARRYGIGVYLYLNEPRAMTPDFFQSRPDMAGVREGELTALCTSHPAVRRWMAEALEQVFREVPGLAGVYAITASENLTSCASHGGWKSCARCRDRSDADIITEVVASIEAGVHRGNPQARVLVSDWGWRGHGDASDFIGKLPKSVCLMSVSEWDLPIERGGIRSRVGEYSISAVGPGPRSLRHWKLAQEAGLRRGTEIQFNNTCELASIPYLPVMDLVAEHCVNLAPQKLDAMLIGWTMGGYPSPNFRLAQQISRFPEAGAAAALDAVARERFGAKGAPHARKAWQLCSDGFRQYPFHVSVVYTSPVQWGPANPLPAAKTGFSATMWGLPYDDLDGWRGPYPADVLIAQFEKMAAAWRAGIAELALAVQHTPARHRAEAAADLRFAQAAAMHFQSVANQSAFVLARDALAKSADSLSPAERRRLRQEMKGRLESEILLARDLFLLVQQDAQIGFEPSSQYFYLPLDLVEKVVNCRWLLRQCED